MRRRSTVALPKIKSTAAPMQLSCSPFNPSPGVARAPAFVSLRRGVSANAGLNDVTALRLERGSVSRSAWHPLHVPGKSERT
jgi:hypothetical protein